MKRVLSAGLVLLCIGCSTKEVDVASQAVVATSSGRVQGVMGPEDSIVYRDIPYAVPPVGDRRWLAPETLTDAEADITPRSTPVMCPQPQSNASGVKGAAFLGTEDCLYLDVYTPSGRAGETPWPIMLWIHGGSNTTGHKGTYDFSRFASRQRVVVVVINYRMGPFGWFAHPALNGADLASPALANFGTLDMIEALRWTQRNGALFGGDPTNVTIFGESAGGRNVYTLLASPMTEGLFHKAIAQSGHVRSVTPEQAFNRDRVFPHVDRGSWEVTTALGLADDTVTAEQLRAVSTGDLLEAYFGFEEDHMQPLIISDGVVIPEVGVLGALSDPRFAKHVPVLAGTTRDEVTLWLGLNRYFVDISYPLTRLLPPRITLRDPELYRFWVDVRSRGWKLGGVDEPLAALQATGVKDLYAYRYDWDEQDDNFLVTFSEILGAAHASEIAFIMGAPMYGEIGAYMYPETESAQRMTDIMMSAWGSFARNGAPVIEGGPEWATYDASTPAFMRLDVGDALGMSDDVQSRSALLERIAASSVVSELERCVVAWELLTAVGIPDYDAYREWRDGLCADVDVPEQKRRIRAELKAQYGSVYYPE